MKTKAVVLMGKRNSQLGDVVLFKERGNDSLFLGVVTNTINRGFRLEDPRIYVSYSEPDWDFPQGMEACFRTKISDGDNWRFEYLENLGPL